LVLIKIYGGIEGVVRVGGWIAAKMFAKKAKFVQKVMKNLKIKIIIKKIKKNETKGNYSHKMII